ncbi:MAG TPA: dipeptidase [Allosphingosinicella sp.]|uniref:dipeptidase n=1 Tax=Allosphingosinicella sp. TaxID=2823234 RepID=UPI002EDA6A65
MRLPLLASVVLLAIPASAHETVSSADRLAHEEMLVLDTHLDTPVHFERPGWDFSDWHEYDWDFTQTDIPRMQAGGLDGGFFVIYTPQGPLTPEGFAKARESALFRGQAIQRVVHQNPDKLAFATRAEDAARIHASGKRIVYQSIENSYPLGQDLSLLETFYKMGVRMAGPVHNGNNQFADSSRPSTEDKGPRWNGLSPLGRRWVEEMNRLGMVIDGSHASDAAFDQLIRLSKTPIVLSHSGPRAMFDHPRNISDDRMRALARSGGVMQMNTLFLVAHDTSPERSALHDRQERWLDLTPAERRQLVADIAALNAQRPYTPADFELFMKAMLHAIRVMGIDHVGLGADWDGNGGLQGLWDVSYIPKITARLRREGFSDADIQKIWSGNVLRLLRQAEQYSQSQASG